MRGLDPRIHDESQHVKSYGCRLQHGLMDCRAKPGNDDVDDFEWSAKATGSKIPQP